MFNLLAFDTATDALTVALMMADGDFVQKKLSATEVFSSAKIFHYFAITPQRHAELILTVIEQLLEQAEIPLKQLTAIAFGQGPGSFMGVRIAAGVVQGLAWGLDLPVIPISTLQTLAQTSYDQFNTEEVVAAWDARMQEIYWGVYTLNRTTGMMENTFPEQLCPPQNLILPAEKNYTAAGNAWTVYRETIPQQTFDRFTKIVDIHPHAESMLKIASEKYRRGEVLSAMEAQPIYLRDRVVRIEPENSV